MVLDGVGECRRGGIFSLGAVFGSRLRWPRGRCAHGVGPSRCVGSVMVYNGHGFCSIRDIIWVGLFSSGHQRYRDCPGQSFCVSVDPSLGGTYRLPLDWAKVWGHCLGDGVRTAEGGSDEGSF